MFIDKVLSLDLHEDFYIFRNNVLIFSIQNHIKIANKIAIKITGNGYASQNFLIQKILTPTKNLTYKNRTLYLALKIIPRYLNQYSLKFSKL